ncbi:MAG TPA: hypothetical protein DCF33_21925, partial [Saprospirales bacterium]|nr:hypothetical protein [Saprospirales bacterium]
QTSTLKNPVHIYTSCGNYPVTLISINSCGADTLTQLVVVGATVQALFTYQLTGLQLNFQNQTIGGETWLWDFGD